MIDGAGKAIVSLRDERDAARAEVKRLKSALAGVLEMFDGGEVLSTEPGWRDVVELRIAKARAALGQG